MPTHGETRLAAHVGRGPVDLRTGRPDLDDPAAGAQWGPERTISADILADLLVRKDAVDRPTIHLQGARIAGRLDLDGEELHRRLHLEYCYFDEDVGFNECTTRSISLTGSRLPTLSLRRSTVRGSLSLDNGFVAKQVRMSGAEISGQVLLDGAQLDNPGGYSLVASWVKVGIGLDCTNIRSTGEIFLIGAEVQGAVVFTGAHLRNDRGWTLNAQRMKVGYAVFLGNSLSNPDGFTSENGLRLVGMTVNGFVSLRGAHITSQPSSRPFAIAGNGLSVGGPLMMDQGFSAFGQVDFRGAVVGTELDLRGAQLTNAPGPALTAQRIEIGTSLLLSDGFTAVGALDLSEAKVGNVIDFSDANLMGTKRDGVNLMGARAGVLTVRPHLTAFRFDLRRATVDVLDDRPGAWSPHTHLRGFTYGDFADEAATPVPARLDWLALEPSGYVPQPYEQLASTYRRSGDEEAARKVGVAKRWRQRRTLRPIGKMWNWVLYLTIGYGYRNWQSALWILGLLFGGTLAFSRAYPRHFVSSDPLPVDFNALAYTVDVLLPIVDLGVQSSWRASGYALYTTWILVGLGWLLTTALVASLSGLLKRD